MISPAVFAAIVCPMIDLALSHHSYTPQDVDNALLNELLLAGLRSSSSGNMQTLTKRSALCEIRLETCTRRANLAHLS